MSWHDVMTPWRHDMTSPWHVPSLLAYKPSWWIFFFFFFIHVGKSNTKSMSWRHDVITLWRHDMTSPSNVTSPLACKLSRWIFFVFNHFHIGKSDKHKINVMTSWRYDVMTWLHRDIYHLRLHTSYRDEFFLNKDQISILFYFFHFLSIHKN